MTVFLSKEKTFAFSIAGKKHLETSEKNQDACFNCEHKDYSLLAVADGVGSSKHPRMASRKAIKSLIVTTSHFVGKNFSDLEFINFFEKHFHRWCFVPRRHLATTLLFAIVYSNSNVVIGQAGDGLIQSSFNGRSMTFKKKDDDFTNLTHALRADRKYAHWSFSQKTINTPGTLKLLLCTDGISEDLISDSIPSFQEKLIAKMMDRNEKDIADLVSNWPVRGSTDDKSIALGSFTFEQGANQDAI